MRLPSLAAAFFNKKNPTVEKRRRSMKMLFQAIRKKENDAVRELLRRSPSS